MNEQIGYTAEPSTTGASYWWRASPHKCPVCKGRGKVPVGFYGDVWYSDSGTDATPETCRTCKGSGVLWG